MSKQFNCPHHPERLIGGKIECAECVQDIKDAPDPKMMSVEERITELKKWMGPVSVFFATMWPRLDALVGRGTFNHEWAKPYAVYAEMRGDFVYDGPVQSLKRVMGKNQKPIIVVQTEKNDDAR